MKDLFQEISATEIADAMCQNLGAEMRQYISSHDLRYTTLSRQEVLETMHRLLEVLASGQLSLAGAHRQSEWEKGWGQNLNLFEHEPTYDNLVPKYFGKSREARWRQQLIRPASPRFEASMLSIIVRMFADKYLKDVDHIAEFGCGTGINLLDLRAVNGSARISGLDWAQASQRIVRKLAVQLSDSRMKSYPFDFFSPDYGFKLGRGGAAVTVAALEQVGEKFHNFLSYLIESRPSVCIHIEPIEELLDPCNSLDLISLEYFKRRNYLSGFLPELQRRADVGEVEIYETVRTFSGSLYIEGHSVVVWAPKL